MGTWRPTGLSDPSFAFVVSNRFLVPGCTFVLSENGGLSGDPLVLLILSLSLGLSLSLIGRGAVSGRPSTRSVPTWIGGSVAASCDLEVE